MKEITDNEFSRVIGERKVILKFFSDSCGPCKVLARTLEPIEAKYSGISFYSINIDNNSHAPNYSGVRSLPTLIFLKNGEEMNRLVGTYPQKEIETIIDKQLMR